MDTWTIILGIIITLLTIIILWIKRSLTYWQRKGLITPPPVFFLGNTKGIFTQTQTFTDLTMDVYNYIRRYNQKHGGFYLLWAPIYFPTDPEIIKHIMATDFQHFVDRGLYSNEKSDPLSAHLFSLNGTQWRQLRVKLTPTFTSGKMKMMFGTLVKCGGQLTDEMDKCLNQGAINIKEILVRFTTDVIGSCAFGIDSNSLKNPDNEFCKYGRHFFEENAFRNIISLFTYIMPDVMHRFGTIVISPQLSDFFMRVIKDTVDYREKNNVKRKDFMQLLLQLKNKGRVEDDEGSSTATTKTNDEDEKFTVEQLAAQAFVFFVAGFETSSTTMTFCLFELASNPDVQEKLRNEIVEVLKRHNDELTYEALAEMTYMDKVVNETLRKYPPLSSLQRICTKDYKIPGTDFVIEKGTKIFIPVIGIQRDEEYYPNPEKFDPERFSEENKRQRHPYTFIPFGEGPRICIGLRFGFLQTKVGLTVLLKNYKFSINEKTKIPLKLDPKSFVMSTEGGIWLDYTKI